MTFPGSQNITDCITYWGGCCDFTLPLSLLQIKVMTEQDLLAVACEQFLGKSVMEIKAVVLQTLEGHLRSILGTDTCVILIVCLLTLAQPNVFCVKQL